MTALPDYTTPEALAKHMGWSPRRVKATARGIGACRIMGNRMVLTQADVDAILEAARPNVNETGFDGIEWHEIGNRLFMGRSRGDGNDEVPV